MQKLWEEKWRYIIYVLSKTKIFVYIANKEKNIFQNVAMFILC